MSLARWRATSNILFVLAALSLAACGGSARAENRRGNTLYAQEDYAGALAAGEVTGPPHKKGGQWPPFSLHRSLPARFRTPG